MGLATYDKKALKAYQKSGGNFMTGITMSLRKESDLSMFYYPGISAVLEKILEKPEVQRKMCSHHKTFGLISTRPASYYPLLTAKAALLSSLAQVNVIPLLIRYENLANLPHILDQISINFQAIICTDFKATEKRFLEGTLHERGLPVVFHQRMEAAAVMASINNAARFLKKSVKKAQITIEGTDEVIFDLLGLLKREGADNVTLIDHKGALYHKRPNMNREKIELMKMIESKKDSSTRGELLKKTDIYISSMKENLTGETTDLLPEKAVIISLRSQVVEKHGKQALISTLPQLPNHLTDLHITAGIVSAIAEGKKYSEKTLSQAIKGLAAIYKSPRAGQLLPGLLEKNLAKKIAKSIS